MGEIDEKDIQSDVRHFSGNPVIAAVLQLW